MGYWQDLVENASDLIHSVRPDGGFLYVNRAWCATLGYSREEAAQLSLTGVFDPECRADCERLFARAIAGERVEKAEAVLRARDGRAVVVEFSSTCRRENGSPTAVQSILHDITNRHRGNEGLRDSERRFREITRHAPVGIFLTDPRGSCLFVNERWCAFSGLSPSEAWGHGWERALHADDRARVAAEWCEVVRAGRDLVVDCRFQAPGGRITWLHCTATALRGDGGEIEGYVGMVVDMTERMRAEEERRHHEAQLQQVQKLESLGVLAGGIAHDFNNLLTSMLGYSNLALMQLPVESVACPLLYEIEQAARRAAELTQQMLAYSGKGKFVVQKLGLDTLVQEMATLLETAVPKKPCCGSSSSRPPSKATPPRSARS